MQPTAERCPLANGAGLARQNQECCLHCIIDVFFASQDVAATDL